jgi:hypothetical protein
VQRERLGVAGGGAARVNEEFIEVVSFTLGGAKALEAWSYERAQGVRPGKRIHVVSTLSMAESEQNHEPRDCTST